MTISSFFNRAQLGKPFLPVSLFGGGAVSPPRPASPRGAARSGGQGGPQATAQRRAASLTGASTAPASITSGSLPLVPPRRVMVLSAVPPGRTQHGIGKAGAPMSRARSLRRAPQRRE